MNFTPTKKLIAIDGNSLATASYYGAKDLCNSKGLPTGATYGFVNGVLNLLNDNPTHFCVVFDKIGGSLEGNSRRLQYPTYKANRKPADEELLVQYPYIKRFLDAMRIPHYELGGLEGDDILGYLAYKFHRDLPVYIVTRDRDLFQLCIYNNTYIILTKMSEGRPVVRVVGPDDVMEIMGVRPDQIPYYKAIAGDTGDNIKGVPGLGPKVAIKLLGDYGNIENIVKQAQEDNIVTPSGSNRVGRLIRDNLQSLYDSWDMGKLRIDEVHSKLDVRLEHIERSSGDELALRQLFEYLEFNSLM